MIASMRGGRQHRGWSTDTYLMAAAVDALNASNWQRGGGKSRRPKPVPRPDDMKQKRVVRVADVLAARKKNGVT